MAAFLKYVLANKEWLFSGAGLVVLTGVGGLLRCMFLGRARETPSCTSANRAEKQQSDQAGAPATPGAAQRVPREWQAILPAQSKYNFVSEERSEIPLGLQSFFFVYGPRGTQDHST